MCSPLAAPAKTKSSDVSRLRSWKPVWIPKENCSPDFKYVHIYLYIKMSEQECGLVRCSTPPPPAWGEIRAALMGSNRQPTKQAAPFAPAPPTNLAASPPSDPYLVYSRPQRGPLCHPFSGPPMRLLSPLTLQGFLSDGRRDGTIGDLVASERGALSHGTPPRASHGHMWC